MNDSIETLPCLYCREPVPQKKKNIEVPICDSCKKKSKKSKKERE